MLNSSNVEVDPQRELRRELRLMKARVDGTRMRRQKLLSEALFDDGLGNLCWCPVKMCEVLSEPTSECARNRARLEGSAWADHPEAHLLNVATFEREAGKLRGTPDEMLLVIERRSPEIARLVVAEMAKAARPVDEIWVAQGHGPDLHFHVAMLAPKVLPETRKQSNEEAECINDYEPIKWVLFFHLSQEAA